MLATRKKVNCDFLPRSICQLPPRRWESVPEVFSTPAPQTWSFCCQFTHSSRPPPILSKLIYGTPFSLSCVPCLDTLLRFHNYVYKDKMMESKALPRFQFKSVTHTDSSQLCMLERSSSRGNQNYFLSLHNIFFEIYFCLLVLFILILTIRMINR